MKDIDAVTDVIGIILFSIAIVVLILADVLRDRIPRMARRAAIAGAPLAVFSVTLAVYRFIALA